MALFPKPKPPLLQRWGAQFTVAVAYRTAIVGHHGPIQIVSLSLAKEDAEFVAFVEKALLLIGAVHPRGYRRIKQHVPYVADTLTASLGAYDPSVQVCKIDFGRFKEYVSLMPEEWGVACLACILIHESTHARLHSMRLPYDAKTRVGIERLCKREEERFVARLRSDKYDPATLIIPFDEAWYTAHWNRSQWQRIKDEFGLLRRDIRKRREKE